MKRLESAGISIAVWEDRRMRVIVSESDRLDAAGDGGTIYSPADMYHYVRLESHERRMVRDFKQRYGGTVEWRQSRT
jgi:hypothetical protein